MRSRYSAYAVGSVGYILDTTHPAGPHWETDREKWRDEVARFAATSAFERLVVRGAREDGDRALVDFEATLTQSGHRVVLAERSVFLREGGRWLYHSGIRLGDVGVSEA